MPRPAVALEAEAFGQTRAFYERLPEAFLASRLTREPEATPGSTDRLSGQLFLAGRVWDQPFPGLVWNVGLDTGLLDLSGAALTGDGRVIEDHLAETWLLGATYVDVQPFADGSLVLRAGKLRPQIGNGAIFDAYGLGGLVDLDLRYTESELPFALRVWGGLPSGRFDGELKSSPLLSARATFEPAEGLELSCFGAAFFDRDDALAPTASRALIRRAGVVWNGASDVADAVFARVANLIEADTGTRGTLGWAGAEIAWTRRRFRLSLTGIASFGTIETRLDEASADARLERLRNELDFLAILQTDDPVELLRRRRANAVGVQQLDQSLETAVSGARRNTVGGFLLAEIAAPIARDVDLHGFAVWSRGEDGVEFADPRDGYSGFVSIAPLLPLTYIFFSGSTAPSQQAPSFSSVAPEGSGVLGFGLGPRAVAGAFDFSGTVAALWSDVPPPDRDAARFYGVEVDGGARWFLARYFHLFLQGAWFATGSYFGDAPAAAQVFGGVGGDFSTVDAIFRD